MVLLGGFAAFYFNEEGVRNAKHLADVIWIKMANKFWRNHSVDLCTYHASFMPTHLMAMTLMPPPTLEAPTSESVSIESCCTHRLG